jgi:DNA polymerase-4
MPMAEARRRAPQARFVAPSHDRYAAVSDEVFTVLRRFTPLVESLSIDEAFLDIAGLRLHYETPAAVGAAIRHGIRSDVGIPSSVGIATSKFIAKTASEKAKPDGMRVIAAGEELAFLHPLPIGDLWGVGEATQAALESLGVATIGDLAVTSEVTLRRRLGPAVGGHLAALARGEDDRFVTPEASARSISVEETYPQDVSATEAVERELLRLCDRLAGRLRRSGYGGKTITLKVRFADFTTVTRSCTIRSSVARISGKRDASCSDELVPVNGRSGYSGSASPDWSVLPNRSSCRSRTVSGIVSPMPPRRSVPASATVP